MRQIILAYRRNVSRRSNPPLACPDNGFVAQLTSSRTVATLSFKYLQADLVKEAARTVRNNTMASFERRATLWQQPDEHALFEGAAAIQGRTTERNPRRSRMDFQECELTSSARKTRISARQTTSSDAKSPDQRQLREVANLTRTGGLSCH